MEDADKMIPADSSKPEISAMASSCPDHGCAFRFKTHRNHLLAALHHLPSAYATQASNRMTLLYFILGSLDLLHALPEQDGDQNRAICDWIYSCQSAAPQGGFCGMPGDAFPSTANTYTALASLTILGDGMRRLDRERLSHFIAKQQLPNGCFAGGPFLSPTEANADMRFVYCAAASCRLAGLCPADVFDVHKTVRFIEGSLNRLGGFGQAEGLEGHGGSTYCATAALSNLLDGFCCHGDSLADLDGRERVLQWLLMRQSAMSGIEGRVGKPPDACYSFWVQAAVILTGGEAFLTHEGTVAFLRQCEHAKGGFAREPGCHPDLLHTYMSLCGLSFAGLLPPIDASLGITLRARATVNALRQADWCDGPC
uniref:Prenyltransferase alpha-alpha toroid domain-containing protein n=1 Tax=Vitrella brassicaformis TaxID=1169539 RepID=A0A7S1KDL5_9ALVE|mmetsp:Transcript_48967/g.122714  ORF Transcript_48967/g.122714 Transcript_48967/m.122714 type:complete len:369 (+) Transcript_48967:308-1414(+)